MALDYENQSTEGKLTPAKANGRSGGLAVDTASGGHYAPMLRTSGTDATAVKEMARSERVFRRKPPSMSDAKTRLACAAILKSGIEHIEDALDNDSEFFIRNNALEQAKECLAKLWEHRQQREEPFVELVNALQCVFAERDVECFGNGQLAALRDAMQSMLDAGEIDDDFANSVSLQLLKAGIDVFREIE